MQASKEVFENILNNVKKVIVGKDYQIKQVICCWVSGGHVLLEDVPGTGKTMLARALSKTVHVDFKRTQFTPDLLPSDIIGHTIYHQKEHKFEFQKGPVFSTIFLGDEINRATPRTQSALLESMSESQVTVDGNTYFLDPLFFTIATQNPIDQLGTFQLPEAQTDRFMMKLSMGYPEREDEIQMLKSQNVSHPIESLEPVETHERVLWVKKQISKVHIPDDVYDYMINIIRGTRHNNKIKMGASPRAAIALSRAAQAWALMEGLDYVKPSHVFQLIRPILEHRIILTPEAKMGGENVAQVLKEILGRTIAPVKAS